MIYASFVYHQPKEQFSDHMIDVVYENYPGMKLKWPKREDFGRDQLPIWADPVRMTWTEAYAIQTAGVKLELKAIDGTMMTKMKDRGEQVNGRHGEPHSVDIMEAKTVQITIPDLALFIVNEVTHENDCCTDHLQGMLDDGWRILAVCPPNAQRRPDYILGRTKPK